MKQAVVVVHGMGEQIPMQTLQDFVDAVWTTDESLIPRGRPDSATGQTPRTSNAVWGKPDPRNRSYELRRLTTESAGQHYGTDFYEFYWAHLMHGTTMDQVKTWIFDLLLRRPGRVPRRLRAAWIILWIVSFVVVTGLIAAAILPMMAGQGPGGCGLAGLCWQAFFPSLLAIGVSTVLGVVANTVLVGYLGDVARYLKADPPNVARRQEIREKGVELLETLMGVGPGGASLGTQYDRIVVVGHSLGSFIAYDIVTHCFARVNTRLGTNSETDQVADQPERARLEGMVRDCVDPGNGKPQATLDVGKFQEQQARCRRELNIQGNPWIVSDFVTLGAPLAHAEALMAFDLADLHKAQARRILPTCPPTMERDLKTGLDHFTYRGAAVSNSGDDKILASPRLPHHAAPFAYTRWTNLYSPSRFVAWGDVFAGPVGPQFGLPSGDGVVSGIRDVAVLTGEKATEGKKSLPPAFAHVKYWDALTGRTPGATKGVPPEHIVALRDALGLKSDGAP